MLAHVPIDVASQLEDGGRYTLRSAWHSAISNGTQKTN